MNRFFPFLLGFLMLLTACGKERLKQKEKSEILPPEVHEAAYDEVFGDTKDKECVTILSYENGKMEISNFNYDADAKEMFEIQEMTVSDDVTFKSVTVTDDNGVVTVEKYQLTEEQTAEIGENYSYGYITLNPKGEINSVVFYGCLEIYG